MDIATLSSQLGATGIVVYIAYRIISQLYSDMRIDSTKREERLMSHMDKQADTMQEISGTLKTMDGRICSLELKVDNNEGRV